MHRLTIPRMPSLALALGAVATPLILVAPGSAAAAPNNSNSEKLQAAVTTDGVLEHVRAFQSISDANGGNRAAGTPGYDASVTYVVDKMRGAGYDVSTQEFAFPFFEELSEAQFARVSPNPTTFNPDTEFRTMTFAKAVDVTAAVTLVDVQIPPGDANTSTSGCETSDFVGFPAGNIALVQRGVCPFGIKAQNAAAAGAAAVIVFNEGQTGRTDVVAGTLGSPIGVPVIGTSFEIGRQFAETPSTARIKIDSISESRTTRNVVANSRTGRTDNVVAVGAHLDSVTEGPGINDNGSGSAAILETALQMAKVKPGNQVRFAWWSAEELGLIGSNFYVNSLTDAQRDDIALYLNFDMVGSPNFMRGVYDGDGSSFGLSGPAGSAQIEDVFNKHFADKGLAFQGTEFSGRSDYQAFINNDIPAGGLFTGAEGLKTATEAAAYGGVAGASYDPCYHQACDNLTGAGNNAALYSQLPNRVGNINTVALDTNSDAIAHSVITYAYDTSAVNGVRNPGKSHGQAKGTPGRTDGCSRDWMLRSNI